MAERKPKKDDEVSESTRGAAKDDTGTKQAEERVRQGYEEASHPEAQGDGDPAPRDITES